MNLKIMSPGFFKSFRGLSGLALVALLATLACAQESPTADQACIEKLIDSSDWKAQNTSIGCGSVLELVALTDQPKFVPRQIGGNCRPGTDIFREHRVTATGTWWGPWKKSSGCMYCGNGDECEIAINWSTTVTRTLSVGFGVDSLAEVSKLISINPSFNLGFSWAEARMEGGQVTCKVGRDRWVVSYWTQNQMGWSDSQSREVRRTINYLCTSTFAYGDWLGVGRADWPLYGPGTMNYGCSDGPDAQC